MTCSTQMTTSACVRDGQPSLMTVTGVCSYGLFLHCTSWILRRAPDCRGCGSNQWYHFGVFGEFTAKKIRNRRFTESEPTWVLILAHGRTSTGHISPRSLRLFRRPPLRVVRSAFWMSGDFSSRCSIPRVLLLAEERRLPEQERHLRILKHLAVLLCRRCGLGEPLVIGCDPWLYRVTGETTQLIDSRETTDKHGCFWGSLVRTVHLVFQAGMSTPRRHDPYWHQRQRKAAPRLTSEGICTVDHSHFSLFFSGDWDVHRGYGILTHGIN